MRWLLCSYERGDSIVLSDNLVGSVAEMQQFAQAAADNRHPESEFIEVHLNQNGPRFVTTIP